MLVSLALEVAKQPSLMDPSLPTGSLYSDANMVATVSPPASPSPRLSLSVSLTCRGQQVIGLGATFVALLVIWLIMFIRSMLRTARILRGLPYVATRFRRVACVRAQRALAARRPHWPPPGFVSLSRRQLSFGFLVFHQLIIVVYVVIANSIPMLKLISTYAPDAGFSYGSSAHLASLLHGVWGARARRGAVARCVWCPRAPGVAVARCVGCPRTPGVWGARARRVCGVPARAGCVGCPRAPGRGMMRFAGMRDCVCVRARRAVLVEGYQPLGELVLISVYTYLVVIVHMPPGDVSLSVWLRPLDLILCVLLAPARSGGRRLVCADSVVPLRARGFAGRDLSPN